MFPALARLPGLLSLVINSEVSGCRVANTHLYHQLAHMTQLTELQVRAHMTYLAHMTQLT